MNAGAGAELKAAGLEAAAAYSAQYRGVSMLVQLDSRTLFEWHAAGHPAGQALPIASGTKALAGLLAMVAMADGFIQIDAPAGDYLGEWRTDAQRSSITVRHLLQLTSGLATTGKAGRALSFEEAAQAEAVAKPGEQFFYGSAPFQIFVELVRRALEVVGADPLDYLKARILDRIGMEIRQWRRCPDGNPDFSSGAYCTAMEWAKIGELVRQGGRWGRGEILPAGLMDACFQGSGANPAYGLGWWLATREPIRNTTLLRKLQVLGVEDMAEGSVVPPDLVYAAGAGKQRLYISRQRRLVIVRQAAGVLEALAEGERSGFSDVEFWRRLTGG